MKYQHTSERVNIMRPYRDPTTGEWVAEHETREADGTIHRTTEWFTSETDAKAYVRTGSATR